MKNIPTDIIRIIISYSDIIDLKRQFGIYYKIKLSKFEKIKSVLRSSKNMMYIISTFNPPSTKYNLEYTLPNLENIESREYQNVSNDMINIEVKFNDKNNTIDYNLEIFRLLKKPNPDYKNPLDIYHKGNLGDRYYWDTKKIVFSKN